MKLIKLLLLVSGLCITLAAYPQLNKKIWMIGATGSFDTYTSIYDYPSPQFHTLTSHVQEIEISLKAGYFATDKLVIGAVPTFSIFQKDTNWWGAKPVHKFSIAAGPFVRYYFLDKNKPFNLLVEINGQYGIQGKMNNKNDRGHIINLSILAGPEIFFNSSVGAEILIGYNMSNESVGGTDNPHTDARKGFQAMIGLMVHLKNFRYNQF